MTFLFEILIFIGICFISTISLAGLGQLIIYKIDKNFFESTFYGFIIISLLTTSLHFFFKISIFISILIFLLGLFIGTKVYLFSKTKINNKFSLYLIFFLIFVPVYISQKFHEDFGYYHLPNSLQRRQIIVDHNLSKFLNCDARTPVKLGFGLVRRTKKSIYFGWTKVLFVNFDILLPIQTNILKTMLQEIPYA